MHCSDCPLPLTVTNKPVIRVLLQLTVHVHRALWHNLRVYRGVICFNVSDLVMSSATGTTLLLPHCIAGLSAPPANYPALEPKQPVAYKATAISAPDAAEQGYGEADAPDAATAADGTAEAQQPRSKRARRGQQATTAAGSSSATGQQAMPQPPGDDDDDDDEAMPPFQVFW